MRSMTPTRRLRPVIAALTAALLSSTTITTAVAESESPFGDAVRVADNSLDTMRGGFSGSDGGVLRFGVNLETSVNGQPIGSVSISNNAQGKISATVKNLGRTFILQPDGTVQVKSTIPAGGTSSSAVSGGTSAAVTTLPTTVTMQLGNPAPGGGSSAPAPSNPPAVTVVTTTLVPALPSSAANGATLVSTGLLPSGNGIMTTIQNTRSNVVINALNTLNIQISGVGTSLPHSSAALHGFSTAINFSLRH
jgi:hypothetical protein